MIHFVQLKQQEKQQHFDCNYNYNFFDFSRLKQSFMPLDYEAHYWLPLDIHIPCTYAQHSTCISTQKLLISTQKLQTESYQIHFMLRYFHSYKRGKFSHISVQYFLSIRCHAVSSI